MLLLGVMVVVKVYVYPGFSDNVNLTQIFLFLKKACRDRMLWLFNYEIIGSSGF